MTDSALAAIDRDICGTVWTSPHPKRVLETVSLDIGPRLAGSEAMRRGLEFVAEELRGIEARDVHLEPVSLPAWDEGAADLETTAPFGRRIPACHHMLSQAGQVEGPLVYVADSSQAGLDIVGDRLRGAIVLVVGQSIHGWGAFDFGLPAIVALPEVVQAVGEQVAVLVDSGFRSGNDIFKALALGAQGVGFATSVLMAASAGGAEGVEQFIGFVSGELKRTMAICGCPNLSAIDRSLLVASPEVRAWW